MERLASRLIERSVKIRRCITDLESVEKIFQCFFFFDFFSCLVKIMSLPRDCTCIVSVCVCVQYSNSKRARKKGKTQRGRHQPTNGVSNPSSFSIIPQYGISFFLSSLSLFPLSSSLPPPTRSGPSFLFTDDRRYLVLLENVRYKKEQEEGKKGHDKSIIIVIHESIGNLFFLDENFERQFFFRLRRINAHIDVIEIKKRRKVRDDG